MANIPLNIPCEMCDYNPTLPIEYSVAVVTLPSLSGNRLFGLKRGQGWAYTAARNKIQTLLEKESVIRATKKRRVIFTRVYGKGKRAFDNDNLITGFKPFRDVLTRIGWIVDDTPKWLEAHYNQHKGDEDMTIILIQDVTWPTV